MKYQKKKTKTTVKKHNRKGTKGVKKHSRGLYGYAKGLYAKQQGKQAAQEEELKEEAKRRDYEVEYAGATVRAKNPED